MKRREMSVDRVQTFTDGVFAVVITILVIDLHSPARATWTALFVEWPTALSYAVSYLFVAIAWLNGHHLLQHASRVSPKLLWSNFAHLFSVSLVPFVTAWMSTTRLGAVPVCLYAFVFVLVNLSYIVLCSEAVDVRDEDVQAGQLKNMMLRRATITLCIFTAAALAALWLPILGFCIVTATLLTYLRPDARSRA